MIFTSLFVVTLLVMSGIAVLAAVALFRRPPPRRWFHWATGGVALVLSLGTLVVLMFASHVVRVRADGSIQEQRLIGTATEIIDGREIEITARGSGMTVVLNEMGRGLQIRTLVYGDLAPKAMVPPDAYVEPHSAYSFHGNIDYLGPGQRPPSSVATKGGGKVKYWLTW
jgi:hypothetical protein